MATRFRPWMVWLWAAPLLMGVEHCRGPYDGVTQDGKLSYYWLHYNDDGKPAMREQCAIRYKINKANGVRYGLDGPALMRLAIEYTGAKAGLAWTFDGFTNDTSQTAAGRDYMNNTGVLIEFRNADGYGAWSQPKPTNGPTYVGGVLWVDMTRFSGHSANEFTEVMEHEVAHQYGLADLYAVTNLEVDKTSKMYMPGKPFNAGDVKGLRAASAWAKAHCQ